MLSKPHFLYLLKTFVEHNIANWYFVYRCVSCKAHGRRCSALWSRTGPWAVAQPCGCGSRPTSRWTSSRRGTSEHMISFYRYAHPVTCSRSRDNTTHALHVRAEHAIVFVCHNKISKKSFQYPKNALFFKKYFIHFQIAGVTKRLERAAAIREECYLLKALALANSEARIDEHAALRRFRDAILAALNDAVSALR